MKKVKTLVTVILGGVVILALAVATYAATAIADPLQVAVGARPLGMGNAYVAVAEEAESLFVNPAGLGGIKSLKLTSMYTTFMTDVSYIVLGGIYPIGNSGSVGVGVARAGLTDIQLYDDSGTSLGTGNWDETVIMLSYGTDLATLGMAENVKVGASLKNYSRVGTHASLEAGNASTLDMDLGVLYVPVPWMTLGANLQNFLPTQIRTDNIETVVKLGSKMNILGRGGTALNEHDQKLAFCLDMDLNTQTGLGSESHIGLEYWPVDALALRLGLENEDSAGGGGTSNLTAGLGLRYAGIDFNYAYHPYGALTDDTTHYFSVGYVGEEALEPKVTILSPEDKTITHDEAVKVVGIVENLSAWELTTVKVLVNGEEALVDETGRFELDYSVEKLGKKLIVVEVVRAESQLALAESRILRLASFVDVGEGYWAKDPIEQSATVALVQGYPDGTFRPNRALTRAELATLLVRAMGHDVTEVSEKPFKDVKKTHWAAGYIQAAQRAGYVIGYPDGTFRPNQKITKVEGLTVMVRLDNLPLRAGVPTPYSDVKTSHWAAKYINAAKGAGMLDYLVGSEMKPKANLSRAETVEMLSKTQFAGAQIKELMSWFVGFKEEVAPEEEFGTTLRMQKLKSLISLN